MIENLLTKFKNISVKSNGIKNISEKENLTTARNWEESNDKKICVKKIEAVPTSVWCDGWYKNPSSGRSINYGVNANKPQEHFSIIIKGGSFYLGKKCKKSLSKNSIFPEELYGGITFEAAKREHDIARLIQDRFMSVLNKKANCPQPMEIREISHALDGVNNPIKLTDFFMKNLIKENLSKNNFTMYNFIKTAARLDIDIYYPMSEEASEEIKKDSFGWLIDQCLEKAKQGLYQYRIDGPNTRLMDLMTLSLSDRQKYFIAANNAINVGDALESFSSKLAEFYALLHKTGIGYHSGTSEHCTLIDTTVSGVVMDIGGLSQENPIRTDGEEYIVQIMATTNLLGYLCRNIFKVDQNISEKVWNTFWMKYKNIYWDGNLEFFSGNKRVLNEPEKIRTQYVDSTSGNWITLAPDLKDLSTSLAGS